jgi:hypothetical protein
LQLVLQETTVKLQQVAAAITAAQQLLKTDPNVYQEAETSSSGRLVDGPVDVTLPTAAAEAVAAVLSLHGRLHGGLQDRDHPSMGYQSVKPAFGINQASSQPSATAAGSATMAQGGSTAGTAAPGSQAAHAQQSSSRKLQFDLSVLSASLPDLEVLLAEDYQTMASSLRLQPVTQTAVLASDASHAGTVLTQQSTATAIAPVGAAPGGSVSSAAGGTSGTAINPSMTANCFSLPIELCVLLRRGNMDSVHYAYPYLFGYYALVLIQLFQTIMNASSTGTMVVDAQLLLGLLEQLSTLVALNGGLGTLVNADYLMHMMPM